ncbi:MAG: HAD hydrolase-like protein [Candidatus Marinimicrobia bacterium]|nr:HAD hydrolase-like protein [Candidatus Neomarinimicrobiota bacterium]
MDIDGTLISPGMAPRQSLREAIHRITGERISFEVRHLAGYTDPGIVVNALDRLGISATERDGLVHRILTKYLEILAERYPHSNEKYLFPGVIDLLNYLQNARYRVGLITGNMEQGAAIKLKPFGLMDYFSFGVYGSDHHDRDQLPLIALQKVRQRFNESYSPVQVVVIGDTVRDVWSAHRNRMRCIAVIRHEERREAIVAESPDLTVSGFENIKTIRTYLETLKE